MPTLVLDLPSDVYRVLDEEATRAGKAPQTVVEEWLVERLGPVPPALSDEREKARQVLREAGLLAELGPESRRLAERVVDPEDVQRAFERAGGKPLSEIVLEQRGPKE